jgi:hypothetical protein
MGRRSRKRASAGGGRPERPAASRAERDAARRERARAARPPGGRGTTGTAAPRRRRSTRRDLDERPEAPWGSFPIGELVVLVGLVLIVWGVVSGGRDGNIRIAAGLGVASLAGLELAIREHWTGFRSHTTLLAGVSAFAVVSALALGPGPHALGALLAIAGLVFALAFYGLRELFKRRSGGVAFR